MALPARTINADEMKYLQAVIIDDDILSFYDVE